MKLANNKIVQTTMKHGGELVKYLSKNSPVILTGCAVAGAVTAVVLAVKATKPALEHIDEAKIEHRDRIIITNGDEREEPELTQEEIDAIQLKPLEIVQATWKDYIPTAIALAGTTACIIGAHSISAKRTAAMAALYTMSESALKEYKEKAVEIVGKGKAQKIQDEVMADKVRNGPKGDVIVTGHGDVLCYEPITGRYFKSNADKIRRIEAELTKRIYSGEYRISLNEFFYELGLDGVRIGDDMGWCSDDGISLEFTSSLTSEGTPVLAINYNPMPYQWYVNG